MNDALIDKLAEAVLYEGFLLYPYRPSLKNTQRWTFGGLFPRAFCEAQQSVEAPALKVECLIEGDEETRVIASLRFLRLIDRTLGRFNVPRVDWSADDVACAERVASMTAGNREFHAWQEAADEKLLLPEVSLADLLRSGCRQSFELGESVERQPVADDDGRFVGFIERTRRPLAISLELSAVRVAEGCFRLTLRAVNETEMARGERAGIASDNDAEQRPPPSRDEAALQACIAAHAVIAVHGGELVSQMDPPERHRELAAGNQNVGVWPVLVGDATQRSTMLAAPIILYDYPQIAPESPTSLFDSTEIDEILSLRIMTMTDDEKQAMRALDPRGRGMLERVEALSPAEFVQLHGTVRGKPRTPHSACGLAPGDRVRLMPRKGADLFDLFLDGKSATITSIEEDFEGRHHFAVVIDDDPGRDLGIDLQVGHRFFFQADEIEPITEPSGIAE
jgi:hypothetical protein